MTDLWFPFGLIAFVLVSLWGQVMTWRRERREHREFMAALHERWREDHPRPTQERTK